MKKILTILLTSCTSYLFAQHPSQLKNLKHLLDEPKYYKVVKTNEQMQIDGKIDEKAWNTADWTESFVDIEGDLQPKPTWDTKVKMLWDDQYLYIAAKLEEPDIWAKLDRHDQIVFHDNDFEVFIDPDDDTYEYYELELNAINTIFDLYLNKPYRNGGKADIPWNFEGLQTAVQLQGTLNNPSDKDSSWTIEIAIPYTSLNKGPAPIKPTPGSHWRFNFSRVEWDTEIINGDYKPKTDSTGKRLPEHNWVWSPQGAINMHFPERWGYLHFATPSQKVNKKHLYEDYNYRKPLWRVYYLQKLHFAKTKAYATDLKELGLTSSEVETNGKKMNIKMTGSQSGFSAALMDQKNQKIYTINQDGMIKK